MSTRLSFKAALERPAGIAAKHPAPTVSRTSDKKASVALVAIDPIDRPVDVIKVLASHGVSLKRARMSLDRLAQQQTVPVDIDADRIDALFEAMRSLGITGSLLESRPVDAKNIREKQGLSQSVFASLYGLDLDTLKNWEQNRYAPDGPARTLLSVIERCPQAVIQARSAMSPAALTPRHTDD